MKRTITPLSLAEAAEFLCGDNLPSGSEKHISRLALLLETVRQEEREACAAYCLDRADQYETQDPIWVEIAQCAEGIAKGEAAEALRTGETEDLLERVRKMSGFRRKTPAAKRKKGTLIPLGGPDGQ